MKVKALFAHIILYSLAFIVVGCSSKKSVVKGSSGYQPRVAKENSHTAIRDYSSENTDAFGEALVAEARRWIGTPYAFGGQDFSGTDCSGLVMEVYRNVCSIKLPRTTVTQKQYCLEVARNNACVGDLFFFGASSKGSSGDVSHVGIYIGGGEMIHASTSRGVMISPVDDGYWGARFRSVGRVERAKDLWAQNSRSAKKRNSSADAPVNSAAAVSPDAANAVAVDDAFQAVKTSASGEMTIDNLDTIINQKVDSIFSSRFLE